MMLLNEYAISKELKYHIENGIGLVETIFRIGSDAYLSIHKEARTLFREGFLSLNDNDTFILEKLDTGESGYWEGKKVNLDLPRYVRDSDGMPNKKFVVFRKRKDGKKNEDGLPIAVRIGYGHPDYEVNNADPEKARNFRDRHKCSSKKDMYSAGWWSCYAPKYFSKQLGLVSDEVW